MEVFAYYLIVVEIGSTRQPTERPKDRTMKYRPGNKLIALAEALACAACFACIGILLAMGV